MDERILPHSADKMSGSPESRLNFKSAICSYFGCDSQRYASKVFWRCLYWHAIPFAFLLKPIWSNFFREDYILIKDLERTTDMSTVRAEVANFSSINKMGSYTLRNQFHIRLSGKKVMKLASTVFEAAQKASSERSP